jgi:hypothetical protein
MNLIFQATESSLGKYLVIIDFNLDELEWMMTLQFTI